MTPDIQDQILRTINAGLQSKKLYPPGHPSVTAPARKIYQLLTQYLKDNQKLSICCAGDTIIFEDVPVEGSDKNYPDLVLHMKGKRVEALIFERGLTEKEVFSLIDVLSIEEEIHGQELQRKLTSLGITHITLKALPIGQRNIVEVYNDAVNVVKGVMDDIRIGKIPNAAQVHAVTNEMTEMVLADPNAMIGLTMIKNYDNYLYNHSVNVSILSVAFGNFMKLGKKDLHRLGVASLLHDVGKTGVAEDIIKKPGGLSMEEWEKIKEHPVLGSNITQRMQDMDEIVCRIIFEHHVRYDKSGYPKVESQLHQLSMMVSVVDAYDALTTLRVYQKPYQPVEAIKVLRGLSGRHFDPQTVKSFENMIGLYPVGTMVRLTTNEIGVVTKINSELSDRPTLKVIYDTKGNPLDPPVEINLFEKTKDALSIIGPVDPLARNMDVGSFFIKEAG